MAAFSGVNGAVLMGLTEMAQVTEWTLDLSMTPVESTDFGKNTDRYIPSTRTATGSFMVNTNTGTSIPEFRPGSAFLGGDNTYALRLCEQGTAVRFNVANANISSMGPSISVKGKAETAFSFSGEVTDYQNS